MNSEYLSHLLLKAGMKISYKIFFKEVLLYKDIPQNILSCKNTQIILTPNHVSWWDGFDSYLLNWKILKRNFNILMLDKELQKYPLFENLGAIGITPDSPKSVKNTFSKLNNILDKSYNSCIAFYPQGEITPDCEYFLNVKRGINLFKQSKEYRIIFVPLIVSREYGSSVRPTVYMYLSNETVEISSETKGNIHTLVQERLRSCFQESKEKIYKFKKEQWITL